MLRAYYARLWLTYPRDFDTLPFDREISLHYSELPLSTLYVDMTSPFFGPFHETIRLTARTGGTRYRVRYRPSPRASSSNPLVISGYGVELALKRTDYIVIDDREAETDVNVDRDGESQSENVSLETEELADLKPLSSSELLGLGLKASSFIMASEDPFETLVKLSQDFPKHSSAMSKLNISSDFVVEHHRNREVFLPIGYNVVWMNGMQIDARHMDAFALLDQLRRERKLVGYFKETGLTSSEVISLLSHSAIAESKTSGESQRYDYRDELEGGKVIIWLNDIERDKRYDGWPTHLQALLQRTYPGQMPSVKKDIQNLVMPLDLTTEQDAELLVEQLQQYVKRKVPVRFGIVPIIKSQAAARQAKILYYLLDTYGLGAVVKYIENGIKSKKLSGPCQPDFEAAIEGQNSKQDRPAQDFFEIIDSESSPDTEYQYDVQVKFTKQYLQRLGADGVTPILLVNGAVMPRDENWLQAMSSRLEIDLRTIQRQVFEGTLGDDTWLAGTFLESAMTHRNVLVIPEDESSIRILNIGELVMDDPDVLDRLPRLAPGANALKQLWAHLVVVANLDTEEGSSLLAAAIKFSKQVTEAEVVILHNPTNAESYNQKSGQVFDLMMERDNLVHDALLAVLMNPSAYRGRNKAAQSFWFAVQPLAEAMGFIPGQQGLLLNGRVVGPIPANATFTVEEFHQLLTYERAKRIDPANTAITGLGLGDRIHSPLAAAKLSSLMALSTDNDVPEGITDSGPSLRMDMFRQWESKYTSIATGEWSSASISITAAIDPTSEIAQRWVPMLRVLASLSGVHTRIYLNPKEKMQELPVKRFYRYVLDSEPTFGQSGEVQTPQAIFEGLPKEALLNLGIDVPPAWLVAPKNSVHDLDNIKLSALKDNSNIEATYELEHILIEGHSRDVTTGQPPRGVQLLLGSERNAHFADTLVMANLGYFQFKANPGYWKIQLQEGRSRQIFSIDSVGSKGYSAKPGDESTEIALMSFQGKTLFPRLSRNPGQEQEDVLEEGPKAGSAMGYVAKASKFASTVFSNIGLNNKFNHADINIFSVASGHLYERMLNIMMVSVMRHTNHTVKFWFIEQFLSPSFKSFLPHLAAAYKFDYEMVTYKWPHWLRAQTEKQRVIWGYKILFLDVLFPLSLDKVIFVDADQIVRTDMYELVTHDLKGAPYGFTPMCDSRTEMEGFRFWKQGYWRNFLRGLPYHISALYVVDLKRFRQIAAGDRLRQQYHQLSADPGSLSNLDQDLPNHMQMQLPIHSLPQAWLWCETWCSDEALKEAKTIDLCNNPQTKEPKLDRARRQVPEWTIYDDEIAGLARRVKEKGDRNERDVESETVPAEEAQSGKEPAVAEEKTSIRGEL